MFTTSHFSVKTVQNHPHRQTRKFASVVILSPVRLTVKMSRQTDAIRNGPWEVLEWLCSPEGSGGYVEPYGV